ncbi:hypothetical protein D3C84_1082360 [compost metagenome]
MAVDIEAAALIGLQPLIAAGVEQVAVVQQAVQRLDRRHLAQAIEAQQLALGAAQHPLFQFGAALDHLA